MRPLLLAVSLFAAACDGRLVPIDSKLSVEPGALQFERTLAGHTRTAPLTLINGSRAPVVVHLSSPAPFELELDVRLAGGEARTLDVTFAPAQAGTFSAVLHVSGEAELDAPLSGDAVEAAVCAAASPCRLSTLDAASNTCVESNAPDGTTCRSSNLCLAPGQCLAGACIGSAASCDDGDRCTVDACEPEGGCLHTPVACAQPADPCQVARCDAASGCLTEAAADGTSCGPSDCNTARVCLNGACTTQRVPDGFACGEETPCRGRGRCSAGSCALPALGPLAEAWRVTLSEAYDFRGVTDAAGNLYWVECQYVRDLSPCELVSYTAAGFQRFRSHIPTLSAPVARSTPHLSSHGRVIVASPNASLAAFSEATGALLWTRAGDSLRTLIELAADSAGRVLTVEKHAGESESWSLNEIAGATGAELSTKPLGGRATGLVLDAHDNRYVSVSPVSMLAIPQTPQVVSYSSGGAQRWSVAAAGGPPVAVFNGELLHSNGEVRAAADGTVRPGEKRWMPFGTPAPLMSPSARFRWQDDLGCGDSDFGGAWQYLEGFTPGVAAPRFSWSLHGYSPQASEMQLLSDGTALFASTTMPIIDSMVPENAVRLRSVDATGAERLSCVIGPAFRPEGPIHYKGATALTSGRWAVVEKAYCNSCVADPQPVLRVFSTPGLSVAATGWTSRRGTPGGTGAPR